MNEEAQVNMIAAAAGATLSAESNSVIHRMINSRNKGIKQFNVVGRTPDIPKQRRNSPCGCGSQIKAKKCCGIYPKQRTEQ
tara:strand:+ start:51 stop:293 length:243 start_codon:yes stop_codon:yes gene_type:complete